MHLEQSHQGCKRRQSKGDVEDQLAYWQQAPPATSFPLLEAMTNKVKEKEKKKKRLSIYLSSKERHKTCDVEFLIIQSINELPNIRNATPSQVVLNIGHGVWGKHELRRIHWNLWVISTHQLTPHPLRQVECLQAHSFKRSGNLRSNDGNSFQIRRSKKGQASPWSPINL